MTVTILFRMLFGILWLTAVGLMLVKNYRSAATLYRIQALAEALIAGGLAVTRGAPWIWLSVGLEVVAKIALVPRLIARNRRFRGEYGAKGPLGMASLLVLSLFFSGGGLILGQTMPVHPTLTGLFLAALFAASLHLSSRYELWSLTWALLSLDTVAGAGTLLLGSRLPEATDVGINLASLGLALVLSYLVVQIERVKRSADIRDLEELVG